MTSETIGVYVHWPFCKRLCPYCDFNIYKDKPALGDDLAAAIVKDLVRWREASGPRDLISLHFGGGTPSLMTEAQLASIIEKAQSLWSPVGDLEIALEANPGDVLPSKLEMWRSVGIERLSIGVQSFDDRVLRFLGRNHDGATAGTALEQAVKIMPRVSADLIYGWVGQSEAHWQNELQQVLEFGMGHISAYQLTIEEKTAFAKAVQRGERRAVDMDTSADLFECVGATLEALGYDRYEVSNFARTLSDRSRHNMIYWQGLDYAGVGPGAHGRLTTNNQRVATIAEKNPQSYIQKTEAGDAITVRESMEPSQWAEEYVLMGLRIRGGISLARYTQISGRQLLESVYGPLLSEGLLKLENDRLSATDTGRLVLDAISHELLAD